jgi:RNA polymerase sigma factor (sigma-70 family)
MDVVQSILTHYKENREALGKKAGRILKDHSYGEDAAQEAYENALKYYKAFNPDRGEFDKWFNKIFWRTISRYQGFVKGTGHMEVINEWEVNPEIAKTFLEETSLSDNYKRVLTLLYVNGYTPKEVAKMDGVSTSVIYRSVHLFKQEVVKKYADTDRGQRGQ